MEIKEVEKNLPEVCYGRNQVTGEVIVIKRGEMGFYPTVEDMNPEVLNLALGVSKPQAEAMKFGSMFGWHTRGADPNNYDENGKLKKR